MSEWWQDLFASGEYRQLEQIPPERTGLQVDFVLAALDVGIGDRLLDVACGIGRHSVPFAAAGLDVTGVDYSPVYLQKAAGSAGRFPARFVRGDMRRLPLQSGLYDAAVSLFSSFGYFETRSEDQATLSEIARALKPGGRFFLDTAHHDGLIRKFQERDWTEVPDGHLLETREWDARRGRADTVWTFVRQGTTRSFAVSMRLYTCPEIEHMLDDVGMDVVRVWGDWEGGDLKMESWRLLVLAVKRGR